MDTSSTPQDQSKVKNVIGKIQALRALGSSTHSRSEAETCLVLASKLIAQYQLQEAELEVKSNTAEGIELEAEHIIYESGKKNLWKTTLASNLASLNGLFIFSTRARSLSHKAVTRFRVIGRPSDIEVAIYSFEYLSSTIQGLADREYAAGRFAVDAFGKMIQQKGVNPEKESYCLGCVQGFTAKMREQNAEVMKTATSQAMVIISNKAGEAEKAYLNKTGVRMRTAAPSKAQRDYSAMAAGYAKGRTLTVDK